MKYLSIKISIARLKHLHEGLYRNILSGRCFNVLYVVRKPRIGYNPWIALLKAWICALRNNPWIFAQSMDVQRGN